MTGHLSTLGAWVAGLRPDDIPADTLRAARYQVANMVAALHAAARLPDTQAVARAVIRSTGGTSTATAPATAGRATATASTSSPTATASTGGATLLGTGQRTCPADAAQANAAYTMAQDFDDIVWMGHTCHSAVFAALAVAEHEARDTRALLTAVVAANEVAGRLGASSFLGPLNGQMWTFIHLIGAAAATASLLGLDETRTTHALAIALAQPTFALQPAFLAPTSKLLSASVPTAIGIQAAYHAAEGMEGEPTLLEDRRGFWSRFSFHPMPGMLGELGRFWTLQTLSMKTFPGCHYFQTACTALERLQARLGRLDPARIRAIRLDTSKLGAEATRFGQEYGRTTPRIGHVNVNFDLATTAAVFLHAGRLTGAELDPAWLDAHTPAIAALRDRATVVHDPALTMAVIGSARALPTGRQALDDLHARDLLELRRRYRREYSSSLVSAAEAVGWVRALWNARSSAAPPSASGSAIPLRFPNRVTLEFTDGHSDSERVDLPVASFCLPAAEAELRAKFTREVGANLGPERAHTAFADTLALESQPLAAWVASVSLA